jgi:hypothetical protein
VVLATLGAPERRRLGARRRRRDGPEPAAGRAPTPVTTGRATVLEAAAPLPGDAEAQAHLAAAGEREALAAVTTLNRLLCAQRIAVRDPDLREVSLAQAIAVRVGYGGGEDAAAGRLAAAVELAVATGPGRPRRRASALRPHEHLAGVVGGRVTPLAAEELSLRARADLERGRPRLAALELRSALEAAVAELGAEAAAAPAGAPAGRVAELRELLPAARRAAVAAPTADPDAAELERLLTRLEAALRARAMHAA